MPRQTEEVGKVFEIRAGVIELGSCKRNIIMPCKSDSPAQAVCCREQVRIKLDGLPSPTAAQKYNPAILSGEERRCPASNKINHMSFVVKTILTSNRVAPPAMGGAVLRRASHEAS